MTLTVPARLYANCDKTVRRRAWLQELPATLQSLKRRWSLSMEEPLVSWEASCAWVQPVTRANGTRAVLKLSMPHMEAEQEIDGLIFWDAAPTVRLLDSDFEFGAMLLERCEPGTALSSLEEAEQDLVLAEILKRLWRPAVAAFPFRPLSFLIEYWTAETRSSASKWHDECLIQEGLQLFHELVNSSPSQQVLATDLHAGNILRAQRAPWLVIDPKPFVGDPAFDATQHLINCKKRVRTNPIELIRRFAGLLELDPERVRLWLFARAAAEPRDNWNDSNLLRLARILAR